MESERSLCRGVHRAVLSRAQSGTLVRRSAAASESRVRQPSSLFAPVLLVVAGDAGRRHGRAGHRADHAANGNPAAGCRAEPGSGGNRHGKTEKNRVIPPAFRAFGRKAKTARFPPEMSTNVSTGHIFLPHPCDGEIGCIFLSDWSRTPS